ncbi:hypothetical protein FRB99_001454 [Tulasnella sp. 403]|nr:hypothetical protein FRB99_001454 [Tulasnella sp. 403]
MASTAQNFSDALASWKDINLSELQKTMDTQGLELVENQKESMMGRKGLADKTKEFKKIPEEQKANEFKTLLKAYQTEIDSLTRRCKTAENAFLGVYKLLAEAPDPYPLLDAAVDQTVKVAEAQMLETELARVREENGELRGRLNELGTLEAAKKKAESRADLLEEKMEAMIQERVTAKENELNATYDERIMNYEERIKGLESQISVLEHESSRLMQALEAQKSLTAEAEALVVKRGEEMAKELSQKSSEIDGLRQKVKQYADYDEIKRELGIMKFVEFAGGDDADQETTDALGLQLPNPNADKANQQHGQSLESLLMSKNKRLLDELTKLRITHSELESNLQTITETLDHCRAELDKQQALNERLEHDLLQINGQNPLPQHSDRPSGTATPSGLGLTTQQDGLSGLGLSKATDIHRKGSPIPFNQSADASILPIVTSQRDRFRQRNAELEEELRKQHEIISELRTEINGLQADNMKLYEKVRYMQSYRDGGNSTILTTSAAPISSGSNDGMSKYSNMYEQSMNPFEAFRGREAARAVQALNPLERGVFVVTRQILANRRARMVFILYSLSLHMLVIFTSYSCASSTPVAPHLGVPS